jgi:BR serine/threonine kinase
MKNVCTQVGSFMIEDEIESGGFGVCHFAKNVETGKHCCVKIVPQSEESKNEIEILSRICHPNIVSLIEVKEVEEFYFIFMELCEGTTLLDMLNKYGALPEECAKYIFEEIVSGLEYLHSRGISHGDIKLENIICSDDMKVKLIDFGFSSEESIQIKYRGSIDYCAPEILSMIPFKGEKADMWSVGVCLFAMIVGSLPFHEEEADNTIGRVKRRDLKIPEIVSKEAKHVIESLLKLQPESRLTAMEVLYEEWDACEGAIYVEESMDSGKDFPKEIIC